MYNVKYHLLLHVYKYFCEWKQKKTTCIVCHFNYLFLIFISLKIKGEIIYMYKLLPVFFKLKPDASVWSRIIITISLFHPVAFYILQSVSINICFNFFLYKQWSFWKWGWKKTSLKCHLLEKKNDFLKNRKYAYLKCLKKRLRK